MRTTTDISERKHAPYIGLAHAQCTNLSQLLLSCPTWRYAPPATHETSLFLNSLVKRGLASVNRAADTVPTYRIDPTAGLSVRSTGYARQHQSA